MNIKRISTFLRGIAANNDRTWFHANKTEYDECRADFERDVRRLIAEISRFDGSIAHLEPKDCIYRFNRDTRFSPDKSPYKRHFGAFICANGRKSLMSGYYIHVEPGHCFLSGGNYWLPTNILTSCRNEIMSRIDEWKECVENKDFIRLFGIPGTSFLEDSPNGFGLSMLKTCPKDFPRDYEYLQYLKMKDYACWHAVADDFYDGDSWFDAATNVFKVAQPMMNFINGVVADYE